MPRPPSTPAQHIYACPNVRTRYRLVEMDTNSPCPMRAPGVVTGILALEMAMDELAEALGMDPLELRLRNHADRDEKKDLPWSSKALRDCYELPPGASAGLAATPQPRSMRDGNALVGWGMATAMYHVGARRRLGPGCALGQRHRLWYVAPHRIWGRAPRPR